jgi:murein DD-endopeptidase MepM/ murein hydrolase activator NlpD
MFDPTLEYQQGSDASIPNTFCNNGDGVFPRSLDVSSPDKSAYMSFRQDSVKSIIESLFDDKLNESLSLMKEKLQNLISTPDFGAKLEIAFGEGCNQELAKSLMEKAANGDLGDVKIEIVGKDILGSANGAYARSLNTIFVSDQFILYNGKKEIAKLVTEEVGHVIDATINVTDAQGDEGEIFADLVFNESLSPEQLTALKAENDSAVIIVGGVEVEIEKNDSLATAEWLGNLNYTRITRTGWLGGNVPNDFYRFYLNNSSNVDFYLTGLGADVDLYLLNSSGQTVLSKSDNSGTSNENINVNLAAGQYFLQVNRWSGDSRNSNYNLSMVVDGAGDSIGGARDIGTLNSPRSYSDWVGFRDVNDYYRFYLSGQSNFSLSLTGLSADADVRLLNSSGTVINRSENSYSSSEYINTQLGAGTYYIQVNSWNGNNNTHYNLSLNATPTTPTGYYSNIESVLNSFFSNTSNTNGENWNNRSVQDKWDRIPGESAQFPGGAFTDGDRWQVDMPTEVKNIYNDLSTSIFGSVKTVNTGYAYDYGYYPGYGAHSALDIGASNGTTVKSAVNGIVVDNRYQYYNGNPNGYWVAIDELDTAGNKTGRRWWYGHLATNSLAINTRVSAGQTVLGTVGQGHLHLGVVNTYTTYNTSMYGNEVRNGSTSLGYTNAVQDVLNRTMNPLQAYWKSRNGIKE